MLHQARAPGQGPETLSLVRMEPLPFSLRVPGLDKFTFEVIASTAYTFKGLLRLDPTALRLEWTGSAHVDEVAFSGIRSERVALPREALQVPYPLIRSVDLRGGWLRPNLELTGMYLDTLNSVPGEDAGYLRLWLARRDRRLARRIMVALRESMALPAIGPRTDPPRVVSLSTPPDPPAAAG